MRKYNGQVGTWGEWVIGNFILVSFRREIYFPTSSQVSRSFALYLCISPARVSGRFYGNVCQDIIRTNYESGSRSCDVEVRDNILALIWRWLCDWLLVLPKEQTGHSIGNAVTLSNDPNLALLCWKQIKHHTNCS